MPSPNPPILLTSLPSMASPQRRPHLKSLTSILSVPEYLASKPITPCKRCMSIDISDLKLQPPRPIDDFLRAHNVPEAAISAVSTVFMDRASQLFDYTRTKLKRLLTSVPCLPDRCMGRSSRLMSSPIVKAWVRRYEDELAWWKENCLNQCIRLSYSKNSDEREVGRPRFNQNSTPFLEAYFELNQYPSPADRQALAQKTGNTPKQIADWFQNHRNRAKKGGKHIRRAQIEPAFDEIMTALEKQFPSSTFATDVNHVGDSVSPECSPSPTENEVEPDQHTRSILHVSGYVAPPHAFPAKYPPNCPHDPFSAHPDFFQVQWERRPANQIKSRRAIQHDIDAFIDEFVGKCNVRGPAPKRKRDDSTNTNGPPWTAATTMTITPASAPLPSFVRNPHPTSTTVHAIQSSHRLIRPLPRRAPNKTSPVRTAMQPEPEAEIYSSFPESQCGARRKIRRLASDSDSSPTPPFPLTPVQDVVSLPSIEDGDLSSQLFSRFEIPHHSQPLTALKTISRSFLDYASVNMPFGTSLISVMTQTH